MNDTIRHLDELTRVNNELADAHRELAKRNAELERLNIEKTRYLGIAAHDLRTPLGVIQAYSEFLLADAAANLSEEQLGFVQTIHDSSEALLALINELLDLSAIESGHLRLELASCDLAGLIARNLSLNRVLANKRGVSIRYESPSGPLVCICDAAKLTQVLNNLVSNAIKYSPEDGEILVRLSRAPQAAILEVRDQGPGIAPADRPKLFQPFFRSKKANPAGEPGAGLGLAITKRIVEGHRGRVWFESEPGAGAAFFFELPVQP